jgi:hypothetical protein
VSPDIFRVLLPRIDTILQERRVHGVEMLSVESVVVGGNCYFYVDIVIVDSLLS